MSSDNPITQDTPEQTLNAAIELLQFVSSMLNNTINKSDINKDEADTAEDAKHLTTGEVAGLCHSINCASNALEYAYAQCLRK
jgi:hypothetical protein